MHPMRTNIRPIARLTDVRFERIKLVLEIFKLYDI